MFGLAYAILPMSETAPGDAITASLARFERGRRGDLPDDWLQFHDETAKLLAAHEGTFTFTRHEDEDLDRGEHWLISIDRVLREMDRRALSRWTVRLADIEPDFDRFVRRFAVEFDRHPVTRGHGRWLNPLGQWDWWDLGGRHDGRIVGARRRCGRLNSAISSGPSSGRFMLAELEDALGPTLGHDLGPEVDVRGHDNVELVSTLLGGVLAGHEHAIPQALVLPPGVVDDALRWLDSSLASRSAETLEWLGQPTNARWPDVVEAIYERFADYWVAGVTYYH